ncbi:MAG: DnaJ domain-containing protein [Deltaproteobacteria bacterium]|nr:DnaJ domain-containing protein [Deltaproteobacteria bacterium]
MGTSTRENPIRPKAVPRLNADKVLESAGLSSEEGYLISRIDGVSDVETLIKVAGIGRAKTLDLLASLHRKGVVHIDGLDGGKAGKRAKGGEAVEEAEDKAEQEGAQEPEEVPWEGMKFDPFDLAEEVDLQEYMKKQILYLFIHKDELTHYDVLKLDRHADGREVKRAYFRVSKDFHPDTYFRKNLGSYKAKVEAIFKRVSLAYDVLSDEQRREAYDRTLPYVPSKQEIEEAERQEKIAATEERLKEERRQRLMKRSPLTARRAKARRHHREALDAMEAKNYQKAANSMRLAMALDPDNAEYKKLLEDVEPEAAKLKGDREYRRGRYEEEMGNFEEALSAYLLAVEANPEHVSVLERAAKLMLKLDRELRQALTFCRLAIELEPDNADVVEILADIYLALGMEKNALREYNRYLKLQPLAEDKIKVKIEKAKKLERKKESTR